MAKKVSAKRSKKSVKPAKAAAKPRRAAAPASGKAPAKAKYHQSGAPWWKQFLPG